MRQTLGVGLYAGGFVVLILAWFSSSLPTAMTGLPGVLVAYGRLAGLIAVYCFLWQLLMMARIPLLEQSFGLDGLTRLHRRNGYLGFTLLITHPFALALGYALPAHINPLTQYLTFVTTFSDVWKAFIGYGLFWIVVLSSIYLARKHLAFETWYFVHLSTYVAILLAFGHQLSVGGDFLSHPVWKIIWTLFYAITFGLVGLYRAGFPAWQSYRQQFRVERVETETNGVTSVYVRMKRPSEFKATAGQFILIRFLTKGRWYQAHPYSLSMVPKDGLLRITARASGDFSSELAQLPTGSGVIVEGPYGVFTSAAAVTTQRLFIAGGIGITPLRAMLEEAPAGTVVLYSARSDADFALLAEVQRIAAERDSTVFALTDHATAPGIISGRIDAEFIKANVPDVEERDCYVCGPPPMMDAIEAALRTLGVPPQQIHDERFAFAGPATKKAPAAAIPQPSTPTASARA